MSKIDKKTIKCAIYTRKSSEEGLEQDFNSLHAQREACESYIKSQQHEGWILVDKKYNDGGFSGGTLERPALKQLFEDIEKDEVNIVVVYKVDRLTRSLMDFAKIVELFDKHSASFVSITQHFNTTTSMGRLTLNVLLSFAQFEREVTGERIRDKIAASKKKGLWMSGSAPIGYKLKEKKLHIDSVNAKKVNTIFEKYLELRSVPELKRYLEDNSIKTKAGNTFVKGHLYRILQNRTYIGKIVHKGNIYAGEHKAIIDDVAFEQAQKILCENRIADKCSISSNNPSLLAGKIFDDRGNYMSPSHSNTRNRKYRYYISQALIQARKQEAGTVSKIPAGEIEAFVGNEIKNFLSNTKNIQQYIENYDVNKQKDLLSGLKMLQAGINDKPNPVFIRSVLSKVILYKEKVDIILCKDQLIKALESIIYNTQFPEELKEEVDTPILLTKNIRISQTFKSKSMLIISDSKKQEVNINSQLVKAITKSYYWNNLILSGEVNNIKNIKKMENIPGHSYIYKILELRYLAPEIIEKILNGTQPRDLTCSKFI
ncbi:MAG: hypothetical protein A2287_01750 [Candidatus Melainabacteria bacterium RIFOXYA12_FULL_32_12]|nr:MAG: hypothetical protein A2255_01040 [Candidatus Melainabacteria bacterium RIFOXYA2_FULL_32_9]OGI28287.1 MAG: hypothetical protein A2287_01750 [Candidatus Melainabacteria bacterium RIFOXYA12_FULL_32_12]